MRIWTLAQYFVVAGQVQPPAMQGIPAARTLPQEPRLAVSLTTSLQGPEQNRWPGGQVQLPPASSQTLPRRQQISPHSSPPPSHSHRQVSGG